MKKIISLLLWVVFLAGLVSIQSCQSTKSSTTAKMLKFGFEKGKGYDYEMIMNMDQEVVNQKMQMDMTFYYSMDVTDENVDVKTITTTYERFKMSVGAGGFNIEIDSDKPLPDFSLLAGDDKNEEDSAEAAKGMKMFNGLLAAIKGRKFVMKVNNEGKIVEITGFEDMAKTIVDSLKIGEKEKEEMMAGFNKQFNEKSVKDQFERIIYIFPNKEVKIGDSWTKTTTPGGIAAGKYTSKYTVTEIEGDMVTLEEKSKIEGANEGISLDGDVDGTIVVDSRSGLIVNADQDITMKAGKEGQTMEIRMKTKIKGKAR